MKQRLQTTLGQHLVLTPQLRQALHILQLSTLELEAEILSALESNPLLDWEEESAISAGPEDPARANGTAADGDASSPATEDAGWEQQERWGDEAFARSGGGNGAGYDDVDTEERVAESENLHDHLAWQLHLSHLSPRDRQIGVALIDAIDDDGYLRESIDSIVETLLPDLHCHQDEVLNVLRQIQAFDPTGVGARDLGECLLLQLDVLPEDTPCMALARRTAQALIEQLPRLGAEGLAAALPCSLDEAAGVLELLRTLDPRPGGQVGDLPQDTYVVPDCVISRHNGMWQVSLAGNQQPRLIIHRGYEQMIKHASSEDSGYLRGHLQEARWLLKNLEARGETLLKVVRCLVQQQSGFLEFGDLALRPLTLREVAVEIGMHESTVSRAVSRKYARTPRGTLPLRAFFASGVDNEGGGGTSSTAIQDMIRRLVEAEDPRKPLSDARLAEALKAAGVAVARRTVAKYREALNIPSSHDRVRIG
ncbi:RNA polymerase factor sigma-54 [Luteimonas vadosa]|uniref:RNA polymerase sigma-54 factor n=1 Tax=Luteimonas vadosa TaxID=1165507 RepID=A0ABP9DV49_9GAMM